MKFFNQFNFQFFSESDREIIKSESLDAEHAGRLTHRMLQIAYRKKLYHLLVPKELGGHEYSLPEAMHTFEEASYLNGSFGWTLTLGAGAGIFSAYMEHDLAEKVFESDKAFIAGSGFPAGKAYPVNGGYKVTGKWKYISGWPHATLFTASCLIIDDNEPNEPRLKAFAFLPEEVQILKNWNSYGLKATSSDDIKVTDLFVPENRSFVINPESAKYTDPLYSFPFEPFAQCTLAISLLGIAERFMDESLDIIRKRSSGDNESHERLSQLHNVSFNHIKEARHKLYHLVEYCWQFFQDGEEADEEQLELIIMKSSAINKIALHSAESIYPFLGMSVIGEDKHINRAWRDLHTASQHDFLTPNMEIE